MSRHRFGLWGIDLDEHDFALALAGLGVFGSGTTEPAPGPAGAYRWELPADLRNLPPAREVRDRWAAIRGRLEVVSKGDLDLVWVAATLRRAAEGVYFLRDDPDVEIMWEWPLRVALFADVRSEEIRSRLDTSMRELVTFIQAGAGEVECDILLLPFDLVTAASKVAAAPRVRADLVLVGGAPRVEAGRLETLIDTLRNAGPSAGVAISSIPRPDRGNWFNVLLALFAHNRPLDAALAEAGGKRAPLLLSSRSLIVNARVSGHVERLGRAMRRSKAPTLVIDLPHLIADRLRARMHDTIESLGRTLETMAGSYHYHHESDEAAASVELRKAVERELGERIRIPPVGGPPTQMAEPPEAEFDGDATGSGGAAPAAAEEGESTIVTLPSKRLPSAAPPPANVPFPAEARRRAGEGVRTRWWNWGRRRAEEPEVPVPAPPPPLQEEQPATPRRVQARFYADGGGKKPVDDVPPSAALFLGVRIGAEKQQGWSFANFALDETPLPPSAGGHDLTIALVELRDGTRAPRNEPSMLPLHLPPAGTSDTAYFPLVMPESGKFTARVIVLYGMRVLQTLVFEARVGERGTSLVQENVVAPGFDELRERRVFEAALIVNDHPDDGAVGLTPITPTTVGFYEPVELRAAIHDLEKSVAKLATLEGEDDQAVTLDDENVRKAIIDIACQGKLIWDSIAPCLQGAFGTATRIQVVEARSGAYLPIELFYSSWAPDDDAAVCAEGLAALASGAPHACSHDSDRKFVCPAAFWGFSRVIERRAHTNIAGGYEYSISEPTPQRARLLPLTSFAVAASAKVRPKDVDAVVTLVSGIAPEVYRVKQWKEWTSMIRDHSPATLLLFPHTSETGGAKLEIGGEELLAARIESDYVRRADRLPGPVVFLLGCNVELTRIAFQNFVQRFRDKGAALVVGTISPIRGRNATRFVSRFLSTLKSHAGEENAVFGDVLLEVKRTMLAEGDPFALTLVAYGDADWQL